MYIRKKKVKGNEYAYLVQNRWKKNKGSRQKVKGYLGRVHRAEMSEADNIGFLEYYKITELDKYMASKDNDHVIKDLIRWELSRHGFKDDGNGMCKNNDIAFDFGKLSLYQNRNEKQKPIVLEMNEGFMCDKTINSLINFRIGRDINRAGYKLAQAFLEAGIKAPQEVFVGFFEKLYR